MQTQVFYLQKQIENLQSQIDFWQAAQAELAKCTATEETT